MVTTLRNSCIIWVIDDRVSNDTLYQLAYQLAYPSNIAED